MVAFLKFYPQKTSFKMRMKSYFSKQSCVSLTEQTVVGGLPFYYIHVTVPDGKIPWHEIEGVVRANHLNVILPPSLSVPGEIRLPLYQPEVYPRLIGYNTFLSVLEKSKTPPIKRRVGIIDLRGGMVNELTRLIDIAGEVVIVTSRPYLYENLQEWATEERGAVLTICGDVHRVENMPMLFLPCGFPFDVIGKGTAFSCRQTQSHTRKIVQGFGISLPDEYSEILPRGYDSFIFASALYEQCGIKQLGNLHYDSYLLNGQEATPFDVHCLFGG